MNLVFTILVSFATASTVHCLAADTGSAPRIEIVVAAIKKSIPKGWTCTVIIEKGKMGHPPGLEEPAFRLDFVNTNLTFHGEVLPGGARPTYANFRLHFHDRSERDGILKIVGPTPATSGDNPIVFGETKDYILVSSPSWQNYFVAGKFGRGNWGGGSRTEEANKAVAPLLDALKAYCRTNS